ncbi:N-acyl homoserine lactonase family protein [Aminobacter aminovorans]|uniref:Glyoxylase-like metal-dependent hydrolase (Beta-lactamase superfamily II) n=1 Tax=Aminobacter aminovorans TaxID=83263 RepID=A0AAC8YVZ0_AMIAI|nr:N-acyl homoserine lactonase family protein [Aminobacter aminovorans]AMS45410.1 metallo-beta-lactamase [Aminobacter aminovorans]MBB3708890.1 glyoxylase-like metal-dependent hydrolase (beta-lactamase superfamily II) [Aminobacter aminovorans]
MSIEPFELFAINFARHGGRRREDNFVAANIFAGSDPHLDDPNIFYYVWVARRSDRVFVIDTGFEHRAAAERGRVLSARPAECLSMLGIKPEDVDDVVLTHLHYDHAGGTGAFPKACFHLQESEAAYATGRCMCHAYLRYPFDVEDIVSFVRLNFDGRIAFHNQVSQLTDGFTIHRLGGHTGGMQVARVFTRRGWVVIASDATHFYANYRNNLVFPLVYDINALLNGYAQLRQLADSDDHIIPGHDPMVMRIYPPVSTELEGIAVRLDQEPIT